MIDAEYTINAVRKTVQKWPQSILIAAEWFVYGKDFPQTILLSLPQEMDASGNAGVFTMIDVFFWVDGVILMYCYPLGLGETD